MVLVLLSWVRRTSRAGIDSLGRPRVCHLSNGILAREQERPGLWPPSLSRGSSTPPGPPGLVGRPVSGCVLTSPCPVFEIEQAAAPTEGPVDAEREEAAKLGKGEPH